MIQFKCRCGHTIRVQTDEAGSSMQCPSCLRLIDVPLLGELPNLADDGTYKTDEPSPRPKNQVSRVTEAAQHFGHHLRGAADVEIDLRVTPEQIAAAGAGPDPTPPPRYDPETGELIRPVEIKEMPLTPAQRKEIPLAKPAITYGTGPEPLSSRWTGSLVLLFQPINVFVMMIVFAVQAGSLLAGIFIVASGLMVVAVGIIALQLTIVSHYGNVIDEIGPEARDELPRFLRDLEGYEDLWSPLTKLMMGTLLCYSPAVICLIDAMMGHSAFLLFSDILLALIIFISICTTFISIASTETANIRWAEQMFVPLVATLVGCVLIFLPAGFCVLLKVPPGAVLTFAGVLAIAGTLCVPAVLLTLMTSGSWINLRPDRVVGVIRQCGSRYVSPLLGWVIGVAACVAGQVIIGGGTLDWIGGPATSSRIPTIAGYPMLLIGIIAMHFFCVELGMLYRMHHQRFPWLFQRHEAVNHKLRTAQIRAATAQRVRR